MGRTSESRPVLGVLAAAVGVAGCFNNFPPTPACVATARECAGVDLVECSEDGGGWVVVEPCPDGCGGSPPACLRRSVCDPPCADDEHCVEASCAEDVCPQGELFCEGGVIRSCNTDGSAASDLVACEHGCEGHPPACLAAPPCTSEAGCRPEQHCDGGQCVDDLCAQGEAFCEGQELRRCDEVGAGSTLVERCDGRCEGDPPACSAPVGCTGDEACLPDEHCDGTTCALDSCPQGERFCQGDELRACNDNGSASSPIQRCAAGCADAACLPDCTATAFWTPPLVTGEARNEELDITLRLELEPHEPDPGVDLRICHTSGTFTSSTVHVRFEDYLTFWGAALWDGELDAAGRSCTTSGVLAGTSLFLEGEEIGGDAQVVSPGYCGPAWGGGCSGDPDCGFCWTIPMMGSLTRTCRE